MSGLSIKALLIISFAILATGCRVAIIVPTGGSVVSTNSEYSCPEASVCEFEVTEAPFSETFTAQASPGYEFEKWSDGSDFLCGESTVPTCVVGISDNPLGAVVIALFNSSYVMPIFTDVGIDTDLDGIRNELDDDDDNDGVLDADDNCPLEEPNLDGFGCASKKVFVTSETYTSNLGGLAGADQKCNALAATAGLSGTYMAWLSDSSAGPDTRFTRSDIPYALVDGTLIASDWDDLVDGALLAAITRTEFASVVSSGTFIVRTNTDLNGSTLATTPAEACGDFLTDPLYTAATPAGNRSSLDSRWTKDFLTGSGRIIQYFCRVSFHLYCFEQ